MARVRALKSTKATGPVSQLYKAFTTSGAALCGRCRTYLYPDHACDGVPAVLRRYERENTLEARPHVDPVDPEWTSLETEEAA